MTERELWYHQTTNDPVVRAQALAAAGVLAAAGWDASREHAEERLEQLVASGGGNPLAWRYPTNAALHAPQTTDRQLARAWVSSFEKARPSRTARLLIDASKVEGLGDSGLEDVVSVCGGLTAPWLMQTGDLPAGSVESVSFATSGEGGRYGWSWPLRVGLEPEADASLKNAIRSVRAAGEYLYLDFASPDAPGTDLIIMPELSPGELRRLAARKVGLAVIGGPGVQGWDQGRSLREGMQSLLPFPIVLIDVRHDLLPLWLNEFTFAVSHNKSLDEAVFDAHRGVIAQSGRADIGRPPILLAAKAGISDALGSVRLQNRVSELIERMERLPPRTPLGSPPPGADALGISVDARTARDYLRDLGDAVRDGRLDFSRERRGARALPVLNGRVANAPLPPGPRAAPATGMASAPSAAVDRYTDIVFYQGKHYSEDDLKNARRFPDREPLLGPGQYTLEVAIRATRIGVSAEDRRAPPVKDPRQAKEDVRVYVFVTSRWRDLTIDKAFTAVNWPHGSDSQPAIFRVEVADLEKASQGTIEVRLYSAALDLLDIVEVTAAAIPGKSLFARWRRRSPKRALRWPAGKPGSVAPNPGTAPRVLSIHVSPDNQGFLFEFKVLTADGSTIDVPARRAVTTQDIEQLLIRIRNFWTELVVTNYADQLTVTRPTYAEYLKQLARLGESAWTLLFGDRYDAYAGASQALGELLAEMPPAEGQRIQVTHAVSLAGFIFPWNILYPPRESSDEVDPFEFWGARYEIEQVQEGSQDLKLGDEPVRISFALDPRFGNSGRQRELFLELSRSAKGKLSITKPISDEKALFAELLQSPAAHLFYFYGHGYVPAGPGFLRYDGVKELKRQIELLAEGSPEREALETLLGLTTKMGDEPWIFIGDSEIKESTFHNRKFFEKRRSIVFLNMCNSADLAPSMSSGFVRVFLQHNASAVIGTESPMTAVFAHEFAKVFFRALLSGASIGTAVLRARREFLANDRRNPLGLAYTLYGRADACLGRGPVIS